MPVDEAVDYCQGATLKSITVEKNQEIEEVSLSTLKFTSSYPSLDYSNGNGLDYMCLVAYSFPPPSESSSTYWIELALEAEEEVVNSKVLLI